MKKRILSVFFALLLIAGLSIPNTSLSNAQTQVFDNIDYQKSSSIRVMIDNRQINFDTNPQIVNGRVLVPMKAIFEALGLSVMWDQETKTVTGYNRQMTVVLTIDSNIATVNNQQMTLDAPAMIIQGRTMIPLRFLSETLGYKVVWIQESNLILMSQSDIVEWRYDGFESVPPYREYERMFINGEKGSETRYNGRNHDVQFYNLYSADGRIVPNVADFNIPRYGTGWFTKSPFAGKTYWIDADELAANNSVFFDTNNNRMNLNALRDTAPAGNYIKITISDHFFDLFSYKALNPSSSSSLTGILEPSLLDGKEISSSDTMFSITINDQYRGLALFNSLSNLITDRSSNKIYAVLEQNPRSLFNWSDDTWNRLKGENPWTGMTKDMLLVQKLRRPDKSSVINTRFSVLELLVYEYDYVDAVYYFDDGILTSIL